MQQSFANTYVRSAEEEEEEVEEEEEEEEKEEEEKEGEEKEEEKERENRKGGPREEYFGFHPNTLYVRFVFRVVASLSLAIMHHILFYLLFCSRTSFFRALF